MVNTSSTAILPIYLTKVKIYQFLTDTFKMPTMDDREMGNETTVQNFPEQAQVTFSTLSIFGLVPRNGLGIRFGVLSLNL